LNYIKQYCILYSKYILVFTKTKFMKSRRSFIQNGSLAALALVVTKPFDTVAQHIPSLKGAVTQNGKILIVHSAEENGEYSQETLQHIHKINSNNYNVLFVEPANNGNYILNEAAAEKSISYKIIYKGDIKIAIIDATKDNTTAINKVSDLVANLKADKNCAVVICLSNLGYKNKNEVDDLNLAFNSTGLDIIIGSHATNFCKKPYIALNHKKEEVIINHSAGKPFDLGKIAIAFDSRTGKKNNVSFS
jgi:hypothetical protein